MNNVNIIALLLIAIVSYALGNINMAIILGRLKGIDIRNEGSGNAGMTNTIRVMGMKSGIIVLIVDVLKAFIAVKLGYHFGAEAGAMTAFVCVVLGHCYPAAFGFRGGKGVAASLGAAFALNWLSALAALLIAGLLFAITRRMSVASLGAAALYPVFVWFYAPEYVYLAIAAAAFLVIKHAANIRRIARGEEAPLTIGHAEDEETVSAASRPVDYYAGVEVPDLGEETREIAVIGNGSFGTAIANLLAYKGHEVTIYGRSKEAIDAMRETGINEKYLPGCILSSRLKYTNDIGDAVSGKSIVIYAVPAQKFREVSESSAQYLEDGVIAVNLAKGIERKTLRRMSEVAAETIPEARYVALSGPSHAEELVRNLPASVVAASADKKAAEEVQDAFMTEEFRIYTQDDMTGVEIAGSVKNVIAITTGIADGMKLGNNARAALMTRATHEIKRLGTAMGADPETFAGLSGIGDLIVTCSTDLSRNRRCGLLIGSGLTAEEAVEKVGSVVEGYYTADAVCDLARNLDVDMPICKVTLSLLKGKVEPEKAVRMLMSRDKKDERQ